MFLSGDEVVGAAFKARGRRGWNGAGDGYGCSECCQKDNNISGNVTFVLDV